MDTLVEVGAPCEGAATLTLHRPQRRNALSIALRDEVSDHLDALAQDPSVKAVVITGAGEVFSAGFDLSELATSVEDPALSRRLWASSDRFHHTVLGFPLPLLAALNGPALAGGFDLATMCDLRIVADTAYFERPEVAWADGLYGVLHDLVGGAVARDLTLTGRRVEADEALALGLAQRVVPPDRLIEATSEVVAAIVRPSRDVLLRTKAKMVRRAGLAGARTLAL